MQTPCKFWQSQNPRHDKKYILMMGYIGPIANVAVRIVNIQITFNMMGNSQLKMVFMLNEWAEGEQMAQR